MAKSPAPSHMDAMPDIHAVAVFCGSRTGNDPAYRAAAQALGRGLAEAGIQLVYGGGRIGLMGVLADAVLAAGGSVLGIIPEFLTRREVAHARHHRTRRHRLDAQPQAAHVRRRPMRSFRCLAGLARWTRRSRSSPGGSSTCMPSRSCCATWPARPRRCWRRSRRRSPRISPAPERASLFEVLDGVPAVLQRLQHLHRAARGEAARL